MQPTTPDKTAAEGSSMPIRSGHDVPGRSRKAQFLVVVCTAILIAAAVSHLVTAWFGLYTGKATYRRIGPTNGPQVFCAGSSLLQFGLSWPEVSEALGQGIENWGVGGSSPDVWEVSQRLATKSDLMIVGVSTYDLNEYHLCDSRAQIVSVARTIQDLWEARVGWQFAKRVLSQYPLACLRVLFPTAGRTDAVLVGLRRKVLYLTGSSPTVDEKANALVLPSQPVLDFGESTEKLSDWPAAKTLRRLVLQRTEIQGAHVFVGPKKLALLRMLDQAQQRGRVIVTVMPVAPVYAREFLTPEVRRSFESTLADARHAAPQAEFLRLDLLPALRSDEYFSDFVHLNGAGRRIATEAFLKELKRNSSTR
jgi:hypothetical protein